MDPNATWNLIIAAIRDGDAEAAFYSCQDLLDWLNGGGCFPYVGNGVPTEIGRGRRARLVLWHRHVNATLDMVIGAFSFAEDAQGEL